MVGRAAGLVVGGKEGLPGASKAVVKGQLLPHLKSLFPAQCTSLDEAMYPTVLKPVSVSLVVQPTPPSAPPTATAYNTRLLQVYNPFQVKVFCHGGPNIYTGYLYIHSTLASFFSSSHAHSAAPTVEVSMNTGPTTGTRFSPSVAAPNAVYAPLRLSTKAWRAAGVMFFA